jgi:hypothetical protein
VEFYELLNLCPFWRKTFRKINPEEEIHPESFSPILFSNNYFESETRKIISSSGSPESF